MTTAYYNENDPKAAQWLRELIKAGHIAPGDVDERSIEDVLPQDLVGYTQCHFFAGIGGWSYALRLAGWPDDRPVWTGSCPCQPFSAAGKGKGFADERHLWPALFHLVRECRPAVLFGEQVASKAGLAWLDIVRTDLEDAHYAVGAADLCAAGVGAPHIRQRLYWVAYHHLRREQHTQRNGESASGSEKGALRNNAGRRGELGDSTQHSERAFDWQSSSSAQQQESVGGSSVSGVLGHAGRERLEGRGVSTGGRVDERTAWTPSDAVWCRDGKWRPVEPGTFPLAHGVPGRVGLLRGYGNAIVPQVAAAFIEAYLDCTVERVVN